MKTVDSWKQRVRQLKRETYAIWLASRDPRVPWYARVVIAFVVVHTFSPIDLIPDFIPVLGYVDDLIIAPLGIALALKMVPPEVLAESREKAEAAMAQGKPIHRAAAVAIVTIWLLAAALVVAIVLRFPRG